MKTEFKWWLLIPFMCVVPKRVEWIFESNSYDIRSYRLLWIYINMLITATLVSFGILCVIL